MSRRIEKPLKVGKIDTYSLKVNNTGGDDGKGWLGDETLTSATVTVDNAFATDGTVSIIDNVIYVFLTGVTANTSLKVHFDYATATRSDCDYIIVRVEDC